MTRGAGLVLFLGVAAAAPAIVPDAHAASLQVDVGRSSITAVAHQMGVPIEGTFRRFAAQLDLDPQDPGDGVARIEIEVGSYDLGDQEFNSELRRREWFDAEAYPVATFETTAITTDGAGRLQAAGRLTIKGRTVAIVAPVTHRREGEHEVFEGVLPVRRLQFDIGSGAWADTSVVADEVEVRFRIVTTRL